jgi:hypothetical protein
MLRLSMTLAHNRGDLTQGMGFWRRTPLTAPVIEHLSDGGRFSHAVQMYQQTGLSAEGHRHYPLRSVKVLRHSQATLLPLSPFSGRVERRGSATRRKPRSAGGTRGGMPEDTRAARLLSRDH